MLRRQLGGRALVYTDRGDVESVQRAVDEDDPGSFREEAGVVVVLAAQVGHLARDEDHPLHLPVEQHVHVLDLAESGALGRAEDGGVAARPRCGPGAPARSSGRSGSRSSGRSNPITPVAGIRPGGTYSSSRIERSTRSRVSCLTATDPRATREAVATLTPAWRATSRSVDTLHFFVTRFHGGSPRPLGRKLVEILVGNPD